VPGNDLADVRTLLEQAMNAPNEDEWFGDYRIGKVLGRGGMGVVFEADAPHLGCRVALKRLLEPDLASESEERRFLFGAEAQSRLKHRHIVKVRHVGKCRGRAYFTMELMSGRSLRDHFAELTHRATTSGAPRFTEADLALLAKVADAVTHAHAHGLLHRDLKPENILFDADGEPQIADFGIAKEADSDWSLTEPGAAPGSVAYMSPEQAAGRSAQRRSDVYTLGVLLYELITGRRPFWDTPLGELRQRIASDEPVRPPRAVDPRIPDQVERVCLKCLEKDPEQRYLGALALRDDLRCLADRREPSIPPPSAWGRAVHALRRRSAHAKRVARIALGALALVAVGGYALVTRARSERTALETNAFIATAQAGAALFQFREFADRVEKATNVSDIVQLGSAASLMDDPPASLKALADGFDAAFVLTKQGYITAQWPLPPRDVSKSYGFRDYFQGAARLGKRGTPGAYVARAFRSERDGEMKFGVSAPLFENGAWVGVLVAVVPANPAFGRVRMRDQHDGSRITALIGPRDIDRGEAPDAANLQRLVVLVHDGMSRGEEIRAPDSPALQAAVKAASTEHPFSLPALPSITASNYQDPVRGHAGGWNAAFAPVGGTGYVIVVQSRQ
jgi:hypothetical protein